MSSLTTIARIKSRLEIPTLTTTWDDLLTELIKGASDVIEQYCGRVFTSASYTNQLYSPYKGQGLVFLRAWPVTALSAIQYRAGTPASPSWTSFLTNDYELEGDGALGAIRLYLPVAGPNSLRVTYTAGYTINFAIGHTLPYSISEICEKMVVYRFKKRTDEGKATQSATESAITWITDDIPMIDQKTLNQFKRPHFA